MTSLEKLKILTPLQKLPKNVGDLGKFSNVLKSCPKSNELPNLVRLLTILNHVTTENMIIKRLTGQHKVK